jgi:diaminohydroxyphosphoribosylaminopyrimidine deaminase / 5-amino-6-(5-phosphoribosylamino)uracil reductase
MSLAMQLAENAKGSTFPNPAVGAVIVKNGRVIGKGATSFCGGPHAEINALSDLNGAAQGAALYVTLEPCCHYGRTSPCTSAIISAGIQEVYVSLKDPNPLVNGKGNRVLRQSGVRVSIGLLSKEAHRVNEDFFHWIVKKRPWVSVKLAMTLDGRIADFRGDSQWITSPDSRQFDHCLRARHAGIAVGRTTLEKDNPKLTVRFIRGKNPVRFVFSSKEKLPTESYFVKYARPSRRRSDSGIRSVLVVSGGARSKQTRPDGVEVWHTGTTNKNKSLYRFLDMACKDGCSSILVEGGSSLASGFIENRLVNRLYLFYGNRIFGDGISGIRFSRGLGVRHCICLDEQEVLRFGPDVLISGIPRWS